jgi:hypothetical protein
VAPLPISKPACGGCLPDYSYAGIGGRAERCTGGVWLACDCLKGGQGVQMVNTAFERLFSIALRRLAMQLMSTARLAARLAAAGATHRLALGPKLVAFCEALLATELGTSGWTAFSFCSIRTVFLSLQSLGTENLHFA